MKQYNPQSHFFTDLSSLAPASGNDGFGPVNGALSTKYRTTSFVNGTSGNKVKLYAISDGSMMILPQRDNSGTLTGKLNIVIKPSQMNWEPLKIKYFIYRGVQKEDFLDINDALVQPVASSPEILTKMWVFFKALNGLGTIAGNIFPVASIFQLNAPDEKLLDEHLRNTLLNCKAGEHIGYFDGRLGLDIVLDYGDYQLENQENLFNLNIQYACKDEFVFDTSSIPGSPPPAKVKRYREYIHQFIDAAAFWGSHINCGTIQVKGETGKRKTSGEISPILKKYQTGDRLYIYIQGQNNRSFNYYDSSKKIYGFDSNGEENKKNEWPILIKNIVAGISGNINFQFDFLIENTKKQEEVERNISLNVIAANKKDLSIYPLTEKPTQSGQLPNQPAINISGQTSIVKIDFPKDADDISCATFTFFNCKISQKFPLENYFNQLWISNLKSSLTIDPNEYEMYSCTYDRGRNIDLNDIISETAIIQNKVFFDKGKNAAGSIKRRRLYSAIIKNNSNKESEYNNLNLDSFQSTFVKINANKQDYFLNLFKRDKNVSIYKGTFTDISLGSGAASIVNSLTVFHESLLLNKNSYLFLGITEDEYSLFTIPSGADNIFFDLLEDTTFTNESVRKFKLGLRYENDSGNINNTIYYPSSDIFVYSLDDLFFFSKEFSEYQYYFNQFAPIKIEFRTLRANISGVADVTTYHGQFGFDWLRIGDNYYPSTTPPAGTIPMEPTYKQSLTGGYERRGRRILSDTNSQYETPGEAFLFLQREYLCLPTTQTDEYYYVPYLTLFSKTFHDSKISDNKYIVKPPYEAYLQVIVEAYENVSKLDFEYDPTIFTLDKTQLLDKAIGAKRWSNDKFIKITCKKDFNTSKFIKVWATIGAEKKLAGVIAVNPNDVTIRKTLDIVCVKVQTNADVVTLPDHSDYERGVFENAEKDFLFKALHQILIVPNIIEIPAYLALENDGRFQAGGQFVEYDTSENKHVIKTLTGLHSVLKQIFLTPQNSRYANSFINFAFGLPFKKDDPTSTTRIMGAVEDIGIHCSALFDINRDTTLGHELIHGLGIYHTHIEKTKLANGTIYNYPIEEPFKKYTFYHPHYDTLSSAFDKMKTTDNIMSYNSEKKITWQWQKKIIYKNLQE